MGDVEAEIEDLHRAFERWFNGEAAASDTEFARFEAAFDPSFVLVSPSGELLGREPLLARLRGAHGQRRGSEPTFRIRVEALARRHERGGLVLATYEEWQRAVGQWRGRAASALLARRAQAPGGFAWLHVHETWLARERRPAAADAE